MDIFFSAEAWIALLTLTFLEIVLGIDNIIFISLASNRLPQEKRKKARTIGLFLAMGMRVLMLVGITWIIGFTKPLFTLPVLGEISGRDLILACGGLFLIAKSTTEIHSKIEGMGDHHQSFKQQGATFLNVVIQIILLDIIFSFDSILTAIGMTKNLLIMILAVIISIFIMMRFAGYVSNMINKYPTLQMLALSFLILIGVMLFLEAFDTEISKGYIYFAVFFSLSVELLNLRLRQKPNGESKGQ